MGKEGGGGHHPPPKSSKPPLPQSAPPPMPPSMLLTAMSVSPKSFTCVSFTARRAHTGGGRESVQSTSSKCTRSSLAGRIPHDDQPSLLGPIPHALLTYDVVVDDLGVAIIPRRRSVKPAAAEKGGMQGRRPRFPCAPVQRIVPSAERDPTFRPPRPRAPIARHGTPNQIAASPSATLWVRLPCTARRPRTSAETRGRRAACRRQSLPPRPKPRPVRWSGRGGMAPPERTPAALAPRTLRGGGRGRGRGAGVEGNGQETRAWRLGAELGVGRTAEEGLGPLAASPSMPQCEGQSDRWPCL